MKELEDKIQRLERFHREANSPIFNYLNPGLPEEEVLAFFDRHSLPVHPDAVTLYRWHNGISIPEEGLNISEGIFWPMACFYSLDMLQESREDLFAMRFVKNPADLLPLFGSTEDDLFLLNAKTGEISYMSPLAGNPGKVIFRSCGELLDFVLECYEEGILTVDAEEGLLIDDDRYFDRFSNL